MKTNLKHIIYSIIFAILFAIILIMELTEIMDLISSNNIIGLSLAFLAIIVSATGMYVSIVYGVVKLLDKNSGGKKNGKKKK